MDFKNELGLFLLDGQQVRRKKLLENLLKGKKTVATLYWALRYGLLGYLGLGRYFDIRNLDYAELKSKSLITEVSNNTFLATNKGVKVKKTFKVDLPDKDWSKQFQKIDVIHFKQRFLLFIQVASEYIHGEQRYYALNINQRDKQFVKNYFRLLNKNDLAQTVKNELMFFLSELDDSSALLFSLELIGYHNNGNTMDQIARKLDLDIFAVNFIDLSLFCLLTERIADNPTSIFKPLLHGLSKSFINQSALKTFKLYNISHDIELVKQKRSIKESTIYEHLLELAIYLPINKFPYSDFITITDKKILIKELGRLIDTWRYEDLPNDVKKDISFFKFRLIEILLTKRNLVSANGEIKIDKN